MFQLCLGCMKPIGDEQVCPHCGYVKGTPAKEPYHIAPGVMLRKYLIGRVLGYGGFGVTYLAYDTQLETKVAIKEYLPGDFATRMPGETKVTVYSGEKTQMFEAGRDKFMDEARRLAQFASVPGIVTILDVFDANGTCYIVMEFLEGETVRARLEREKKLPEETAVAIMLPVLDALTAVHEKGIIHRDISPDNIFLTDDGQVKVLDFGAARYASAGQSKSLSVILKPGYAPEEQYRSHGEQGPWSDVYACAATLYKMLSGQTPEDAMERCSNDEVKPLSKMHVSIRKEREIAIMNAMNVYQEHRTQSAAQFKEELIAGLPVRRIKDLKKGQSGLGWTKLQKGILAGVLALLAATAGIGVYGMVRGGTPLYIFSGESDKKSVPDVTGQTDTVAEKNTRDAGLIPLIVNGNYSDTVERGLIVNQMIAAGKMVDPDTTLEMIMSLGPEQTELPDVTGLEQSEAENLLTGAGFRVKVTEEASNVAPGLIIRQSPEAGLCSKNTEIEIVVSIGKDVDAVKTETLGDYVGKNYDDVVSILDDKDIYVRKVTEESNEPEGTVLAQDIEAGQVVHHGDILTLTVSSGRKKYTVKDYTARTYADAYAELTDMGFAVKYEYAENTLYARDVVLGQSVAAGTVTDDPASVTITLTLSDGGQTNVHNEPPQTAATTKATKATTVTTTTATTAPRITTAATTATRITTAATASIPQPATTGVIGRGGSVGGLRYSLDYETGELYIFGNGEMYDMDRNNYPWANDRAKIRSVVIAEGVAGIGANAFEECTALEQVILPSTLSSLPEYVFYNCTALKEITIPGGVRSIEGGAFSGCTALHTVRIESGTQSIGTYAFMNCSSLDALTLPETLVQVQQGAFYDFTNQYGTKADIASVEFMGTLAQWAEVVNHTEVYNDILLNSWVQCSDGRSEPMNVSPFG